MARVLVTGANGFVGSHICEALLTAGFEVKALVRRTSNLANIENLKLELVYGELSNLESLCSAVAGVDLVVSNAGLTKALTYGQFQEVNGKGIRNLLEAVNSANPDIKKFVQISSVAACGPAPSATPIDENYPPNPVSSYGRSKLSGEREVLFFKDKFPVCILRPSAVYGPRDRDLLPFFRSVKYRIKPSFGYGERYINFTYVRDLAQAVVKSMSADIPSGSIYFVAEKKPYSYSQAGDIISELLGVKALDVRIPFQLLSLAGRISETVARMRERPAMLTYEKAAEIAQKYWLVDSSKIERDIGFVAGTDFPTGAEETIAWYRKRGWL